MPRKKAEPNPPPPPRQPLEDWKPTFFAELKKWGVVAHAAREAGISTARVRQLRKENPEFAAAYAEAIEEIVATMEVVARQRALVGVRTPVLFQGKVVHHINEVDSSMLRWLLARLKPEVYGEKAELRLKHEGEIDLNVFGQIDLHLLTDDELHTLDTIFERALARGDQDGARAAEPASVRAPGVGTRRSRSVR